MKSPFKFLDSYTKDDREIFFGRDREIEELYHRVFESRIMLVYGVSGTGKSSLIHCGLANKFQDTDWLPIVIRRGGNIIESMAASIKTATITEQEFKLVTPSDFKKGVRSLYLDHYKPAFFIFDQFEELFIFGDKEERRSFISVVKSLFESEIQCRLIFVMREEYMAGVTEFERFIPTFFSNRVRIEKMSHRNAIDAIKGPCNAFNINIEEGFAEMLLEKLSPEEADVELTYLQVFLDKIFRLASENFPPLRGEEKGGLSFTLSLLQKTGNVSDLLGSFLDEQISLLVNPDEGMAVLKSFVSVKGSRKQINLEEVSEYAQTFGQPIREPALKDLIQIFINLRILRDKDQNEKYELRHDALATKIYEKITLVEKEILEIRQFIDNAYNSYKKRGVCLTSDDLNYIAPYESRLFLSKELSGLIDESRQRLTRVKQRRKNVILASAFALFVVLTGFTVWALKEKRHADQAGIKQLESILKLNESFEKVKKNQAKRKNEIYQLFEFKYMQNPLKIKILWDKALNIQRASNELTDFIFQLESKMISEAENISLDSAKNVNLAMVKNKSNTNIPKQVLFDKDDSNNISNVLLLKQRILNYKHVIYDQIDRKDWDKINFSIETENPVLNTEGDSTSWEIANFRETILAGAVTNLNNLITEINYIEMDAINLISSWIESAGFSFDVLSVIVIPKSTYVVAGSSYEAELRLNAYSSKSNLVAYIFEGKDNLTISDFENTSDKVPIISEQGIMHIKIPAEEPGPKQYAGFISVKRPDGTSADYVFNLSYLVGAPNIVVSPVAMDILYLGVDNQIDVSIPGVTVNQIEIKATNSVHKFSNGRHYVRPLTNQECEITVSTKDMTSRPFTFRVKKTPDPVVAIGNNYGGTIAKTDVLISSGINARQVDFDFDVSFEILEFTVMVQESTGKYKEERTKGSAFSENQKIMISKLNPGQYLFIKDIKVHGSDGQSREINWSIFKIQ